MQNAKNMVEKRFGKTKVKKIFQITMKSSKLILHSLINSLGVFVYTSAIAWFLFNNEKFFGNKEDNFLMPVFMMLLLVLSATITGLLVLGRPIYLFLNNSKPEAIKLLLYTIGWLAIFVVIVLAAQLMF